MTLERDSPLAKWAYVFEWDKIPKQTSLCALFWRAVLLSPTKIVFAAMVAVGLLTTAIQLLAFFFHFNWRAVLFVIVAMLAGVVVIAVLAAGVVAVVVIGEKVEDKTSIVERVRASFLVQGAKAVKSKYCPIVEIR